MALAFLNNCIFRAASNGTGSFVHASAITGYQEPDDCTNPSVVDGATYRYDARSDDNSQWEVGYGVYTASSDTLTRATILASSNAGAAVSFSAAPSVAMGGALAQDQVPSWIDFTYEPASNPTLDLQFTITMPQGVSWQSDSWTAAGPWALGPLSFGNGMQEVDLPTLAGVACAAADSTSCITIASGGDIATFSAPNLTVCSKDFTIGDCPNLVTLSLSSIKAIGGALSIDNVGFSDLSSFATLEFVGSISLGGSATSITTIDMPALKYCPGQTSAAFLNLTSFEAPALLRAGSINLSSNASLATVDLGALEVCTGSISIGGTATAALDLSALEIIYDLITVDGTAIASFSLPSIVEMTGVSADSCSSLVTFSLGAGLLVNYGSMFITNCALDQTSVDEILVSLADLDGTGGTVSYDNNTVDLSGGTSASPSGTGLAAKAVLEGRGNTVTVN
jgi:hypothetical protein